MINKKIRWGILGLGKIAHKFAQDLLLSENAELTGVASRDIRKAEEFASKYHAAKYYGSYEELVQDNNIDVIYIATPHVFHRSNTLLCLDNNKAVLCEKAFAINNTEVKEMISKAQDKNLFLMEAMWTRFIPGIDKILELIEEEVIGDISRLEANFGFIGDTSPEGRLYNRALGGGALLDIGIYPVYLSLLLLGMPEEIQSTGVLNNNVDISCQIKFSYPNNVTSHLECTFTENTSTEAVIYGTKGKIIVHRRFHHPTKIEVILDDGTQNTYDIPYHGNGYYHEIEEVNQRLYNNELQSDKMKLQDSLDLISLLDSIREQLGVVYINDEKS